MCGRKGIEYNVFPEELVNVAKVKNQAENYGSLSFFT
jgi:hypothetical protein